MSLVQVSFLQSYSSLETAVMSLLGTPKQQIKKFFPKSSDRKKPVSAQQSFWIPLDLIFLGRVSPEYVGPRVQILTENDLLMALNKPFNLHTSPQRYTDRDNLLSFLNSHGRGDLLRINEQSYSRGLLNRLDSVTSGLVLLLKNPQDLEVMRKDFHHYVIGKTYLAIVTGHFEGIQQLEDWLKESGPGGERMVVKKSEGSVKATLTARALIYNKEKNLTLLAIELHTGVRHQIRVQLAHLGFPILGDSFYGAPGSERTFLHSYSYRIMLPSTGTTVYEFFCREMPLFDRFFDLHRALQMV